METKVVQAQIHSWGPRLPEMLMEGRVPDITTGERGVCKPTHHGDVLSIMNALCITYGNGFIVGERRLSRMPIPVSYCPSSKQVSTSPR